MQSACNPVRRRKAASITSSKSVPIASLLPSMWRRIKLSVRTDSESAVEYTTSNLAGSSSKRTSNNEHRAFGAALSSSNYCHGDVRAAYTCSKDPQQHIRSPTKPLPKPPNETSDTDRHPKQASAYHIDPEINSFRYVDDNDTIYIISPLERQILQCLEWLARPSHTPSNVLVHLGAEAFWMSAQDANMLDRIGVLTEDLTRSQKEKILDHLDVILHPLYQYPLKQVLTHGVVIVDDGLAARTGVRRTGGSLGDLRTGRSVSLDLSRPNPVPDPLRINVRMPRLSESPELLPATLIGNQCAISEHSCAHNAGLKQPGSVCDAQAGLDKHTTPGHQGVGITEKKPGSVRNAIESLFIASRPAPRPPGSTSHSTHLPAPYMDPPKQPGSVRNARLAAEKALGHSVGSLLPKGCLTHKPPALKVESSGHKHSCSVSSARGWHVSRIWSDEGTRRSSRRQTSLPHLPVLRRWAQSDEMRLAQRADTLSSPQYACGIDEPSPHFTTSIRATQSAPPIRPELMAQNFQLRMR